MNLYKIVGNESTNLLKLIGIITMSVDHFGKVFYPDGLYFQLIGRITFPIFAYCLVVGFLHTSDFKEYAKRLGILALISQPVYMLAFNYLYTDLNILVTLLAGLISLKLIAEKQWWLYALLLMIIVMLKVDYGIQGILLINIIYLFRDRLLWSLVSLGLLFVSQLFINLNDILFEIIINQELIIKPSPSLNVFGISSLLLIYIKIRKEINLNRKFFYFFYPLHLLFLWFLSGLFQ